jgi:hypothetical protein
MSSDEGHGLARPIARHLHMQPNLGTTKEQTSPPRSRRDRPGSPHRRLERQDSRRARNAEPPNCKAFRHSR